ncbi:MAG: PilN domain-containing protein [Candidatus Omnitrophica bacterium]|nr:PilN domain-containing protein [Candidatus Omnitrophota bacterium]
MIEINLLPEELKKKQERFKKIDISKINVQNIQVLYLAACLFGILIIIQIILFFIGIYSKSMLTSLEARYKEIFPKVKEALSLKSQVETINKKITAIDELMVKRFSWAKKLNDLSDTITPGIWLTELSYNEKLAEKTKEAPDIKILKGKTQGLPLKAVTEKVILKYLVISGFASSMGEEGTALVGKFIKNLKENDSFYSDFSDIELDVIKSDRIEEQEVMNFKITCLFKETK